MATITATYALNMNNLNLNDIMSSYYSFYNNVYRKYGNVTYEDVAVFSYGSGYADVFGGRGLTYNAYGVTGGTITGYLGMSGVTPLFAVQNFSYSALSMWNAAKTIGTSDDFAIFASILGGADTFLLSNGADVARAYAGNDVMYGRGGNDVLLGDAGNDQIFGESGNDTLYGGIGADRLSGGIGIDTLVGGSGADSFIFATAPNATTNRDIITDFYRVDDSMLLENAIFTKLGAAGTMSSAFFTSNTAGVARDANDYIVYESDTGKLFYDADGSGRGAPVLIATLSNKAVITYADFIVI